MSRAAKYALSRFQERSTVAGIAGFAVALLGLHASPDTVDQVVNFAVMGASLAATLIPGGK